MSLVFESPNRFVLSAPTYRMVSDGKTITVVDYIRQNYVRLPLPEDLDYSDATHFLSDVDDSAGTEGHPLLGFLLQEAARESRPYLFKDMTLTGSSTLSTNEHSLVRFVFRPTPDSNGQEDDPTSHVIRMLDISPIDHQVVQVTQDFSGVMRAMIAKVKVDMSNNSNDMPAAERKLFGVLVPTFEDASKDDLQFQTAYTFKNVEFDRPIDPKTFEFTPDPLWRQVNSLEELAGKDRKPRSK